jgi:integrase
VPLSRAALEALEAQRERVSELRGKAPLWTTDDLVFPNAQDRPLRADKLLLEFQQVCCTAGLPPKRLHDLRHTFATRLYRADVHPRTAQKLLGHSRIEMTMDLYTGAVTEALRSAVEALG